MMRRTVVPYGTPTRLGEEDLHAIVETLAEAFAGYPVMRYVLARSPEPQDPDLTTLVRFFVMARLLRDEPILGIRSAASLSGVALVSFPDGPGSPASLARYRERTWSALGAGARQRYERFGMACGPFFAGSSRVHLNMIGVRSASRGTGIAGRLIDAVIALARGRTGAGTVSLTTEDPANLPLYHHHGFTEVGHVRVDDSLESWGLTRTLEGVAGGS